MCVTVVGTPLFLSHMGKGATCVPLFFNVIFPEVFFLACVVLDHVVSGTLGLYGYAHPLIVS